jgi:OOP family OmpA-OmpF porin
MDMKNNLLIVLLLVSYTLTIAQGSLQWASEVMYVTSEYGSLQYTGSQALGKPNVFPQGKKSPNAWRPKKVGSDEFIVVNFKKAIRAQQIIIAETENPGAVSKVFAYDSKDNEYLLFELNPRPIPIESRMLNLFFDKTPYEVAYIRIDLAGGKFSGFNSIDAIGISDSKKPIRTFIEIVPNINTELVMSPLSKNVNSPYIEFSPLLSADGNTLYFSRRFHPDNVGGVEDPEDIWYSEKNPETGEWLPSKNLGAPLNTAGPNFISSITKDYDGSTVLLLGNRYEKKGKMTQGVSMSRSDSSGNWEKPTNLNVIEDYNYSEKVDYYLNSSIDVMIISAEREDTYGGRDLYVSFYITGKEWSEPLNLGKSINSADIEQSPFLFDDNETMYFSSSGSSGYGGADIYMTKRLDDTWTSWTVPENMGKGINTAADDVYFNLASSGEKAYVTRSVDGGDIDLFEFKIKDLYINQEPEPDPVVVNLVGQVYNTRTNDLIPNTTVILEKLGDGSKLDEMKSTPDSAKYNFNVDPWVKYVILAKEKGYLSVHENINLSDITESTTIVKNIFLNPLERDSIISINGIYFEFDKALITQPSYVELDRIIKILKSHKLMSIEISAHTDSKGKNKYNLDLSIRRAQTVYDYFKENGIVASRMRSKGYGESKPIGSNKTEAGRSYNRRVEF